MRKAATGSMALVSAASLVGAGLLVVAGVIDAANPLSAIYFFMAAAAAIAAGLLALTARGLWRDRGWAWAILGILGLLVVGAAWQINQSYYGDGSLVALTPITQYLAPFAAAGMLLLALASARAVAGRRSVHDAGPA